GVATDQRDQGQDPDQQEGGADHGVDEELQRGVDPVLVTPSPDEEVHGDEGQLEEEEEQEQVQGEERSDAAGLEQQHPRDVALHVVVDVGPDQRQWEQQGRQQDEEERDAGEADLSGRSGQHADAADHEGSTGRGPVPLSTTSTGLGGHGWPGWEGTHGEGARWGGRPYGTRPVVVIGNLCSPITRSPWPR